MADSESEKLSLKDSYVGSFRLVEFKEAKKDYQS